jgi:kinesin family protein 5
MKGYNCAIICLGAAGMGKTRSTIGNEALKSADQDTQDGVESYEEGIIPSATRELFELMANSSSELEFIVKVSFIEIYREEIFDLLDPSNRFLRINDNQSVDDSFKGNFQSIEGLSEYCCIRASDVITLLNRGYTNHLIHKEKYQTNTNKSHTIFTIKIEMKNMVTDTVTKSSLVFPNLYVGETQNKQDGCFERILQALDDYWKTNNNLPTDSHVKYINFDGSKLTKLLKNALIGNCYTASLVHISSASTSATKTLYSLNIGRMLQKLRTFPRKNVQFSRKEYEEQLRKANLKHFEDMKLLNDIKAEFDNIRNESDDELLNGLVWERLEAVCNEDKILLEENKAYITSTHGEQEQKEKNMDKNIKEQLLQVTKERDNARNDILKLKEECSFLNMQCEDLLKAKTNHTKEISGTRNELHKLAQKNSEMEYNLRTSRFREQESVVFLRHFFRFYRRLLNNINSQGSGDLKNILAQITATPDLSDMKDIADMLVESGLIETFEIDSDIPRTDVYKPSKDALLRSSKQAHKSVQKNSDLDQLQNYQDVQKSSDRSKTVGMSVARDRILVGLQSPGYTFTDKRVVELENEIMVMTNQAIEQKKQIAVLKSQVEELSSKQKKKVTKKQEKIHEKTIENLKSELLKKSADLEGVIWKMNEM